MVTCSPTSVRIESAHSHNYEKKIKGEVEVDEGFDKREFHHAGEVGE